MVKDLTLMSTTDIDTLRDDEVVGVLRQGTEYTVISQDNGNEPNIKILKTFLLPARFQNHLFELPLHLQQEVHIIISTSSGTGLAALYYTKVIQPLLRAIGVKYRTFYTVTCNSITEIAPSLTGTVILLSGDGGVNDLVNFATSRLTIVLFPLGSGNALYNSYINNGLISLLRGIPISLPTFRATFSEATLNNTPLKSKKGAVVLSYGFHASLVEESEKYRIDGDERFEKVAENLLKNPPTYVGTVNGERMKGYALVTLVKKLDKAFMISPENGFRLIHTDTSDLMKGYTEGLGAWKVDRVEFCAEGKMCLDGHIIHVSGDVVVEMELSSIHDLVV